MVEEENKYHKEHWGKIILIVISTFIGAFLAFYFAVDITLNRMMDPAYHMKKMEKMIKQSEKRMEHFDKQFVDNPFEPRLAPMLVNLVKEPNEYMFIVDLKPLNGNEKVVNVSVDDNVVKVSGSMEKVEHHRENILNFSQSYALDEKLLLDKMTKLKKGNKYIITIPYED